MKPAQTPLRDGPVAFPLAAAALAGIAAVATLSALAPEPGTESVASVVWRLEASVIGQVISVVGVTAVVFALIEFWAVGRELSGRGFSAATGWLSGRVAALPQGHAARLDVWDTLRLRRMAPIHYASWALPLLGFIGTVLGLSDAIGGLGTVFDGGDREAALSGVLGDLRFAFDTTLAGLVLVIPVMALGALISARAARAATAHFAPATEATAS